MKRQPWFEIILVVTTLSISLYAALSDAQNFPLRWFTRDDAYYYFKVAQNISEGNGITFDGMNKASGYHPLWLAVCIPIFALARFDLILPLRILLMVMSALCTATGILLYRLLGKIFLPALGAAAAFYWVFSFDILVNIYQQGLESGIAAFFIVLFLYKLYGFEKTWRNHPVSMKHLGTLGLLGALTIFSRLDLVFLVGMAGLWIIFRRQTLRFFLPLDILAITVSVFLAFIIRLGLPEYYPYSDIAFIMTGLSLAIKIPIAFFSGLYQPNTLLDFKLLAVRLFVSSLISAVLLGIAMIAISTFGEFPGFPRIVILLDTGFTLLAFGIIRVVYRAFQSTGSNKEADPSPLTGLREQWKVWMREGAVYFGISFGLLGIYMAWSKIVFGTFSPISGQIKRWWGSFPSRVYGGSTRNPLEFFGIYFQGEGLGWTPIANTLGEWVKRSTTRSLEANERYLACLAGLIVLVILILLINKSKSKTAVIHLSLPILASGATLQALYYHSSGYSAYKEWYWVTQRITSLLLIFLVIGVLFTLTRGIKYRHVAAWAFALWFGFSMGQSYWTGIQNVMRYNRWPAGTPNMEIAALLEENTEAGSMIGMTGGGNVGYFIHDRTIVNMDGLINSREYFEALESGQAGEFLYNLGLDYVFANPSILDHQPYDGQFNEYLNPATLIYGGKQLLSYRAP